MVIGFAGARGARECSGKRRELLGGAEATGRVLPSTSHLPAGSYRSWPRRRFSLNVSTTMMNHATYRAEANTRALELLMAVQSLKLSEQLIQMFHRRTHRVAPKKDHSVAI
jgi:hypothetical protein